MAIVIVNEGLKATAERLRDVPSSNPDAVVVLFKNNVTPAVGWEYDLGDIVEADFNGYTGQPITWGGISIDGDNKAVMVGSTASFVKTAGGSSNTVYGWALLVKDNGDNTKIYAAERFASPVSMTATGATITVTPTLVIDRAA